MSKWFLGVVVAMVASLFGMPAASADSTVRHSVETYTYDSSSRPLSLTSAKSGRVARSLTFEHAASSLAVDGLSYGFSSSAVPAGSRPTYTYDDVVPCALVARAIGTAVDARGDGTAPVLLAPDGVAANAGTRALPVGPWGQKIVDARTKLPSSWGPGSPNAKGVGTRWYDPANKGNGVRIDQGIPGSSFGSQQVDHVVVRSGGRILGPDGKPIVGSLSQNPQAHIPLSDWRNWSSWSTP